MPQIGGGKVIKGKRYVQIASWGKVPQVGGGKEIKR
jgi:hypothetical protein